MSDNTQEYCPHNMCRGCNDERQMQVQIDALRQRCKDLEAERDDARKYVVKQSRVIEAVRALAQSFLECAAMPIDNGQALLDAALAPATAEKESETK